MSTLTGAQAMDEVLALVKAAWDSGGGGAPIFWPNDSDGENPPVDAPWARVSFQHTGGDQCTLGPGGAAGGRRFERTGYVTVQVFVPLGEGVTRGLNLANLALDSFEGKATPSGVWFRRCRIDHVGRARNIEMNGRGRIQDPDPWEQIQAIGEFTYYDSK